MKSAEETRQTKRKEKKRKEKKSRERKKKRKKADELNHWTEKMAPAQQRLKAEPAATLNGAFAVLMTTPATNSRIEVGLPVAMATVAGTFCPCSIRKQISTTRVVHRETSFAPFACMRKHAPAIQFTCDLHIMGLSCSS